MSDQRFKWLMGVIFVLIITLPYLYGFSSDGKQAYFGGFLLNPIDGNSYLAKIYQGTLGNWRFRLPYSAEPGNGAYLFLFYLALGHITRLLQITPLLAFHLARIISAIILYITIAEYIAKYFRDSIERRGALSVIVFGSGLGWLAVPWGAFTSDFWVAEAYPFLSAYTNPHFPLGLAIMISLLLLEDRIPGVYQFLLMGILAIVQPFGALLVLIVRGVNFITNILCDGRITLRNVFTFKDTGSLILMGISGGGILLYQYLAILHDPVLKIWNQQNYTPSPGWIDLIISLSPCIFLAGFSIKSTWKEERFRKVLIWAGISLVLMIIPWKLQRRFISGIFVPVASLSIVGLKQIIQYLRLRLDSMMTLLIIVVLPTNLLVILSGLQAIRSTADQIFIPADVYESMRWIRENTGERDLIVTDSLTGLYLPAYTGRRVIYGHPFETVNAEDELEGLQKFIDGELDPERMGDFLEKRKVDYLLIDDELLGKVQVGGKVNGETVFKQGDVNLFQVRRE